MGTPGRRRRLGGQDMEAQALDEALGHIAGGRPALVLVEGEAGIGKTWLLDNAVANARGRGMQVLAGRGEELERNRPFGLLAKALGCVASSSDPRRRAIAALLASHGSGERGPITVTSDPGLQFRAVDAFSDLVEELALGAPLLIGVDDLQWADPSSLLTLGALSRCLAYPAGIIACFRPAPRVPDLERLVTAWEAAGARHLVVRPLSDHAVTELVAKTVAAEPGPGLLRKITGAAGNPLFITELLAALDQEGLIKTSGRRADVAETSLPPTLRLTILRRLSFLSEDTLRALRAAAILGSTFSLTDLSIAAGRPATDLADSLREAIRARVLHDDHDTLRFRHDLIREAIYADLPASVRRALHRETGQRLGQSGAPALQVAEHLAHGATTGDPEAITWLTRSAREAATTSPQVASDLLERTIALLEPGDPRRNGLLAEQANSLVWAGRAADGLAMCRHLLADQIDPDLAGQVRICLGQALLAHGQVRDALTELERAQDSGVLTGAARAAVQAWVGFTRISLGDLDGAAVAEAQARATASAAGDWQTVTTALAQLATIAELRGDLREALRVIDDAVGLADRSPNRSGHRYPVQLHRGHILLELGRVEEGRAALRTGIRITTELGVRWPVTGYQVYLAFADLIAGEWDDALAELEASLELASETSVTYSSVHASGILALISFHRNDLSRAWQVIQPALEHMDETGGRYRGQWVPWTNALLLEADGRVAEALATLAGVWDQCATNGLALEYPVLGPDLVRLALRVGDRQRVGEVVTAVADIAGRNDVPELTAAALRCRGLAEDDAEILVAAAAAYPHGRRTLNWALTCEDAGTAYLRRGELDRARPMFSHALDTYQRLDAERDLARAESVLREAGVRRGRRHPHAVALAGWDSLTPTEGRVASLVADGLSSPQIGDRLYISRRTVQTHLAHIFVKLDINSRAQLATHVARRQGVRT